VLAVSDAARELIESLVTQAPPKDRDVEAQKRKERSIRRFAQS
jgi:hypothetical protein